MPPLNCVLDMHVIFAVTSEKISVYKNFAAFIGQKDNVVLLTGDRYDLRDLIRKLYASITRMY